MSDNFNQPPFRMPCEAVAAAPIFRYGSPWQHQPLSDLRDKYTNTTTVPDWHTPPGADISPYERKNPTGIPICAPDPVCDSSAPPCAAWLLPLIANAFSHTPGDTVNLSVCHKRGFKNVHAFRYWSGRFGFKHIEDGVDTVKCCTGDGSITSWRSAQSAVADTKYLSVNISAEDKETQYNFDESGNPTGSQVNWDDSASASQSINPNSGVLTPSLTASPNSDANRALTEWLFAFGLMKWGDIVSRMTANVNSPFGDGTITCTDTSITVTGGTTPSVNTIEQLDWDLAAGTFTRTLYQFFDLDNSNRVTEIETFNVSDASLSYALTLNTWADVGAATPQMTAQELITVTSTLSGSNTSASVYLDVTHNLLSQWPLNDDALYPWRIDQKVSVAPLVTRSEVKTDSFVSAFVKDYAHPITDGGGLTLGNAGWSDHTGVLAKPDPNSGTDLVALGGNATNGEVFSSGAVTSGLGYTTITGYTYVGLLPAGCTFNTTTGVISGTCTADCTWGITVTITGAAPAATGAILGAPLPAGYQNYFAFSYQDWNGCCATDPSDSSRITWSWYQVGWGMNVTQFNGNAGCGLPLNCTQWTNYFQAVNKTQGAFLIYKDACATYYGAGCTSTDMPPSGSMNSDALWAGKYAEILEPWPSQNFARPADDDKFLIDENQVYCVTNVSGSGEGSTWNVSNTTDGSTPVDGTDFSGNWGGVSVGGFYGVASYSAGILTLGAKAFTVPSNWVSKSNNDGAFCFGKLRFPASTPSLLGRIAITPDVAGTTFTFGMAETAHTEQVDLYDASMALLASNVTATRINDSSFSILTSYLNAAWVTITGIKYYINDTSPKGDYAVDEWLADFRSQGEYNRLTGQLDCSGTQVARPATPPLFTQSNGCTVAFASFSQQQCCLPFVPCAPKVVCISPNGEMWANGTTYPFPDSFACDELYGSKWWGYVQSTMTDLFWQQPHRPCNIEPCALWKVDDFSCPVDLSLDCPIYCCPGDDGYTSDSAPPVYYFAQPPQVEARLTVPFNPATDCGHGYGADQTESAPALPAGIQIGWLSPVTNSTGDVALPPEPPGAEIDNGRPAAANTAWNVHASICAEIAAGCRFNYSVPGC